MTVTVSFGGVSSTTITGLIIADIQRPLLGPRRSTFTEIPGRAGAWRFPERPGDKIIVVTCKLALDSSATLRTAANSVATWLELSGKQQLVFSDESSRFWYATLEDMVTPKEQRGYAEFDLTFRADPYAYSTSLSTQSLSTSTTQPYTTTFSVTTAASTGYQLDVTPTGALTSGYTLTLNSSALVVANTVAAGQTSSIIFTDGALTVTNNGTLQMSNVSGTPGYLINGTNNITFSRASGTTATTLLFTWRQRYL